MFLSKPEMELLKLTGWCKHIPADIEKSFKCRVFTQENILTLLRLGCMATDKTGNSYRLTPSGNRLLQCAGYDFLFDAKPRNEENVIKRRIASARVLITFYRAGISVFNDAPDSLEYGGFLPSFALRRDNRKKSSLLNSTVFIGAYSSQETLYIVFNVTDAGGAVYYANEMKTFNNLFYNNGDNRTVIFMGGSTAGIAEVALSGDTSRRKNGSYSFAGVYEYSTVPVHFIPTNDDGAIMLKLMRLENYREAIAKATLWNTYKPPYNGLYDTDAVYPYPPRCPSAIAADMDVKRLDRVVNTARDLGYDCAAFYLLPEQEAFMHERYEKKGHETLLIDLEMLNDEFRKRAELYDVADEPFVASDGGYQRFFMNL